MINLDVFYKSQWDSDGGISKDDCGPTCLAMILNYYGENLTTDEVFKAAGAGIDKYVTISQLIKAGNKWGYKGHWEINCTEARLNQLLDKQLPPIALIHYEPLSSRQDKNFKGGHFIVMVGEDWDVWIANDPDFWAQYREHGNHHRYLKPEFIQAWEECPKDGNSPRGLLWFERKVPAGPSCEEKLKKVEKELEEKTEALEKVNENLATANENNTILDSEITKLENVIIKKEESCQKEKLEIKNDWEAKLKESNLKVSITEKELKEAGKTCADEKKKLVEINKLELQNEVDSLETALVIATEALEEIENSLAYKILKLITNFKRG